MKYFPTHLTSHFILIFFVFSINTVRLGAQNPTLICGADDVSGQMELENPDFAKKEAAVEAQYLDFLNNDQHILSQKYIHHLPVVLHIIHQAGVPVGTAENITDADAMAGLALLNNAFLGVGCGGDPASIDTEFRFELAKRDINGQPTTGIERYENNDPAFNQGEMNAAIIATQGGGYPLANRFPGTEYINIYLVKKLCFTISSNVCIGPVGAAFGPASHGNALDGVVIEANIWYNINDPCMGGKVSAHEMGHYFNLKHTYEDGCLNDDCLRQGDRVCDTAPDNISDPNNTACMNGAYNNSCSTDSYTTYCDTIGIDAPDPEDNYMDNSPFACRYRFTKGQRTRMISALFNSRTSFLTTKGLVPPCQSVITAALNVPNEAYKGDVVNISAMVNNADSIVWKVNGTVVSNSPSFAYPCNDFGEKTFTLEAFNATGCMVSATKKMGVYHTDCTAITYVGQIPTLCEGNGSYELYLYPANGKLLYGSLALSSNTLYIPQFQVGQNQLTYTVREGWCEKVIPIDFTISSQSLEIYVYGKVDCSNPQPVTLFVDASNSGFWETPIGGFGVFETFDDIDVDVGGKYTFQQFNGANTCTAEFNIPTVNELDINIVECGTCNGVKLCVDTIPPGGTVQWSGGYPSTVGTWVVSVTDQHGCVSKATREVTSLANQQPQCSAGSDFYLYCNEIGYLNGSGNIFGGEVELEWYTYDGRFAGPDGRTRGIDRPGTYYYKIRNVLTGCEDIDSTLVRPYVKKTTTNQTICYGETFEGHSQSGTYTDSLQYACTCDSLSILNLTVLPENKTATAQVICAGETFEGYTQSGVYQQHFTAYNGCDSTNEIALTVLPLISTSSAQSICFGETYQGHGQSGVYTETQTALNGCDSTYTLTLTVLPQISTSSAQTICFGESYQGHDQSGVYTETHTALNGCDSTHALTLTVLPQISTSSAQTICFGETYQGHDQGGVYTETHTALNGCDSMHTLTLTVLPQISTSSAQTICFGESYQSHDQSGVYTETHTALNGCDSTHTLTLTVLPQILTSYNASTCEGTSVEGYDQSGIYTDTLAAANGCDSIRVLELTVFPFSSSSVSDTICFGENLEGYTQSGIYTDVFLNINGCDSTRTLLLTVIPEIAIDTVIQGDNGTNSGTIGVSVTTGNGPFSYLWSNGETGSNITGLTNGDYSLTITDPAGCENIFEFTVPFVSAAAQLDGSTILYISPNPGTVGGEVKLHIESSFSTILNIQVVDVVGRLFSSEKHWYSSGESEYALPRLTAGFYEVVVKNESGQVAILKLVVQ